jgi:hypothetical protein
MFGVRREALNTFVINPLAHIYQKEKITLETSLSLPRPQSLYVGPAEEAISMDIVAYSHRTVVDSLLNFFKTFFTAKPCAGLRIHASHTSYILWLYNIIPYRVACTTTS